MLAPESMNTLPRALLLAREGARVALGDLDASAGWSA